MRKLSFLFLLVTSSLVSLSQTKQLQPFQSLHVYGPFRVTLVQADKEKIEIDYRGIDKEDVIVNTDDGDLELKLRNKHYWNEWNDSGSRNGRYAKVTVYFKTLKEISVKAGASVVSDFTISSPTLSLVSSMGAEMRLDIKSTEVELESSMGSDVELSGTTETLEISSKMGSKVDAIRLKSEVATVKAYMGSDVTVYASKEVDASAGFGASVNFAGDPSVRNTSHSFGGETNATHRQ